MRANASRCTRPKFGLVQVLLILNRRSFYHSAKPSADMAEEEDVKPKLGLVINYDGTRQSPSQTILARHVFDEL